MCKYVLLSRNQVWRWTTQHRLLLAWMGQRVWLTQRSTARLELWKNAASLRLTKVTMGWHPKPFKMLTSCHTFGNNVWQNFLVYFLFLTSLLDKYAVRFIPRENGLYLIDVKFNGSHIPGSPFKIRVGETGQAGDPGMVSAYGPGLEGGTTG